MADNNKNNRMNENDRQDTNMLEGIDASEAVGTVGGAGVGAAVGSLFGPLGTVAGAVVGGAVGNKMGEGVDGNEDIANRNEQNEQR
ncbi:glycine zipper domain-containing protein [Brevibacillus panacihumi]|uniref:glycine zipper domain-containing protein n=2 Tax=Brevibacillus panacihumi TaxID=497735 RepID=UPI003D1B15C2